MENEYWRCCKWCILQTISKFTVINNGNNVPDLSDSVKDKLAEELSFVKFRKNSEMKNHSLKVPHLSLTWAKINRTFNFILWVSCNGFYKMDKHDDIYLIDKLTPIRKHFLIQSKFRTLLHLVTQRIESCRQMQTQLKSWKLFMTKWQALVLNLAILFSIFTNQHLSQNKQCKNIAQSVTLTHPQNRLKMNKFYSSQNR